MHSIGHFIIDQNPDTKVLYVTSEEFTNEVIESIRNGNSSAMTKFRDKYRTVDVLMIDDIRHRASRLSLPLISRLSRWRLSRNVSAHVSSVD